MRHISANCRLQVVIFPRLSTTRMPSAVDSRVARSSDKDFRWSASAGPRLLPFFIAPLPMVPPGIVIRIRPPGKCFHARISSDVGLRRTRGVACGRRACFLAEFLETPYTKKSCRIKTSGSGGCEYEAAQHRTRNAGPQRGGQVSERDLGPA